MAKEVWIIGVDPPCPRCDLTRQRVERISEQMGMTINVRNLIYSDSDAREFAESTGKELGTAKHVAAKAGIDMDWDHVYEVVKDPPSKPEDIDEIDGIARLWSPEMDEALRPCQVKAESVGVLMTPILVVDEKVKHHGSVPSVKKLRMWLA
jgi:predicted DsbA family dithiol-disulfide isomerase